MNDNDQFMDKQFGNEIIRKKSASIISAVVLLAINLILFLYLAFDKQIYVGFFFLFIFLVICIVLIRIKTIIFYDNCIVQTTYWRKKVVWYCLYEEIERLNVEFYSDTRNSSKMLLFILKDGSSKKLTLMNVIVKEFATIFLERNIPIYNKELKFTSRINGR